MGMRIVGLMTDIGEKIEIPTMVITVKQSEKKSARLQFLFLHWYKY